MSKNFILAEETLGYVTSTEPSNTDFRLLVGGSKNVLIDFQKKVKTRSGYTRLGAANSSLTQVRNAWTWKSSTGTKLPQRFYDDELEVYLREIDGIALNAWYRVMNGWTTTERLRPATIYDATEDLDFQIMVNGDDKLYRWNGAVATIKSATANTITKNGTDTWAQSRFYVNANMVVIIDGTDYTYTGGHGTTTLTGVTPDPSSEAANSVAIQKVVTNDNEPEDARNNHTIYDFENQLVVGSEDSEEVFISANNDYTDFSVPSPRTTGEAALLTLDDPTSAITSLGSMLLIFSGQSTMFKNEFNQVDVGGTLVETLRVKRLDIGVNQGALSQECVIPIGNAIAYLSYEVALRIIESPEDMERLNPATFSNPIKPDFDSEDWFDSNEKPDAYGLWYKNTIYISVPQSSRLYMLNFIEDADGKLFRYWNPPMTLPAGPLSIIDSGSGVDKSNGEKLHLHSNAVPETYLLFDGGSDGHYTDIPTADKLPIDAKAVFAYNNYDKRARLKNFDEYYIEGEITPSTTDLALTLSYDFEGVTQKIEREIDGSNDDILEGAASFNSLAQQSLAVNPLGGLLNPPSDAKKFRAIMELAKEDFFEIQASFSTNDVDKYWAIISHGASVQLSRRKPTNIKL